MRKIRWSQIAVMNQHYRNWSLEYFLETQRTLGFENLELWFGPPHFYLDRLRYDDCGRLRKQISDAGLNLVSVTSSSFAWQYQYAVPNREIWEKAGAYFQNGIRAAAELGASIMTVNSGWGRWDEPEQDAWKRAVDMLGSLAETARREGVILALESLTSLETQIGDTLDRTYRLWRTVDHSNLRVMVDTVAMGFQGERLEDWFEAFGENLVHLHFVDMRQDGGSDDHLIWGDGGFCLEKMIETLERYDYQGYLVQEIVADRYRDDPMEADRRNRDALARWIEKN